MILQPTPEEQSHRDRVIADILKCIRSDTRIMLPEFDPELESKPADVALLNVGTEPNQFGSTVGDYRYQFEGEDDLLHFWICRADAEPLTPGEAMTVAQFLLPDVPPALIWCRPGRLSHHYYLGHDILLEKA
jgi:hypothetical protein